MMTKKGRNAVLAIVLVCALMVNTTFAYAQGIFADLPVASDDAAGSMELGSLIEAEDVAEDMEELPVLEAEPTDDEADSAEDGEELPAPGDAVLHPAAYVTGVNSLSVSGGVENTDYSYDEKEDIITIHTDKAMTITDAYAIYSNDHRTSLVIDSEAGANLTLNTVHIYAYDVTEDSIKNGTAANLSKGRAGIEITGKTGDVTITLQNKGEHQDYGNWIYGGKDRAGIEKNEDHTGKLTIQGPGRLTVVGGWSNPAEKKGSAAIGSSIDRSTSNITIKGGRVVCTASTNIDWRSNDYGTALGAGTGGTATNILIDTNGYLSAQGSFGACIGPGRGATGNSDITINNGEIQTITWVPVALREAIYKGTTTEPAGAPAYGVHYDDLDKATCDITIKGGDITAIPHYGTAFSCGTNGTFTFKGGSVYCDAGYDTEPETTTGINSYGVHADQVIIDAPHDVEQTLLLQSTNSYAMYANDIKMKSGVVAAFGSWWRKTTSTHYGVVVKNTFDMEFGFFQANGGLLVEDKGTISINGGLILARIQGIWQNADTVLGLDTAKWPKGRADISFKNCQIYAYGAMNAGTGTISVSDNAVVRTITGKSVGVDKNDNTAPAYSAGEINITSGKVTGYVSNEFTDDKDFSDIEGFNVTSQAAKTMAALALAGTDGPIQYEKRRQDGEDTAGVQSFAATAEKQVVFAVTPTFSEDYSHQVRAAVNSKDLKVVDEKNAAWGDYTYVVIEPYVKIEFNNPETSVTLTPDGPKVPFSVVTTPDKTPIQFSSSDPERISIDPQTGVATAHHAGKAKITASPAGNYVGKPAVVEFTVNRGKGEAAVSLDDWYFGQPPKEPVLTSRTHDVTKAKISYETAEGEPLDAVPTEMGNYIVKATFQDNDDYLGLTVEDKFSIGLTKVEITPEETEVRLVKDRAALTMEVQVKGDGKLTLANSDPNVFTAQTVQKSQTGDITVYTLTLEPKAVGDAKLTLTAPTNDDKAYRSADEVTINIIVGEDYIKVPVPTLANAINGLTYNREEQTGVVVQDETWEGVVLTGDVKATNAGNYRAVFALKSGYAWDAATTQGSRTFNWYINAQNIDPKYASGAISITYGDADYDYTGSAIKPPVTVKHNGVPLIEGVEYDVRYSNNIDAGYNATITVTGKGNYTGQTSSKFTIKFIPLYKCPVVGGTTVIYNGKEQYPELAIQNPSGEDLVKGRDFVILDGAAKNVGSYIATVNGRGNYGGTNYVDYKIAAANIAELLASGLTAKEYADGREITQEIVLKDVKGNVIPEEDYVITYENNKEIGTAKMHIDPSNTGNLTGSRTYEFAILQSLNFEVIPQPTGKTLAYTGSLQTGVAEDKTYRVTGHQGTMPGVYYAQVTPNVGYAWNDQGDVSTVNVRWEIQRMPLSAASISVIADQVYTGSAITPSPVVRMGDFVVPKSCYLATYANNLDVGKASITLEARPADVNPYVQGSITLYFNITKAEGSITAPTAVFLAHTSDKLTQTPVTVDVYCPGDGALTTRISDPSIAVVSSLTQTESGHYLLTLTPRGRGTAFLHLESTGGKNYTDASGLLYVNVDEVSEDLIIVDVPKGTDHIYNGEPQLGVAAAPAYVTLSGTTVATEVGTYQVTATPKPGHAWDATGDAAPQTITWRITKLAAVIEADTRDVVLDLGADDTKTTHFQLTHYGTGDLTLSSSDGAVANVQLAKQESKAGQTTYTLDIAALQVGSALITIRDEESDNTVAAEPVSFSVSVVNTAGGNIVPSAPVPKTDLVYNGGKLVGITAGTGYTLEGPSVNADGASVGVNAGDYWVRAKVKDGYAWSDTGDTEPRNLHWTIAPASLKDATIEGVRNKAAGESIYQDDMVVRIGDLVIPASEYTVAYDDQTQAGVCTVTITGRGGRNVTGTATTSFQVLETEQASLLGFGAPIPLEPFGPGFALDMGQDNSVNTAGTTRRETAPGEVLVIYDKAAMAAAAVQSDTPVTLMAIAQEDSLPIPILSEELIVEDLGAAGVDVAVIQVADQSQTESLIDQLNRQDGVYAQPNYVYHKIEMPGLRPQATTGDPEAVRQYYLEAYSAGGTSSGAGVYEAWNTVKVEGRVTVAVLDTGCEVDHPDLKANIDTEHMWDAYNESHVMSDPGEHGTHVCGIVGAVAGNGIGIAGASYNAKILPIKVFDDSGVNAYTSEIVKAYQYLADLIDKGELTNLHVINMSLGGYGSLEEEDRALDQAISNLRENYQVLTVAGGGNGRMGMPLTDYFIPSDLDSVLSVTSLDQNGEDSFWSDYNKYKDISAPGDQIYSTIGSDGYMYADGTSMAAPLVSGIAALMFAAVPEVHPDDVVDVIKSTAHSMEGTRNFRGNATGSAGAIDAAAAIQKLMAEYGDTEYFLYNCAIDIAGIDEVGGQYYTGSAIVPTFTITTPNGTVLKQAQDAASTEGDYVVTFQNNIEAGTATMTVTGINRCKGTRVVSFHIYYDLDAHGFMGAIPAQAYDNKEITPIPQVSYDSAILTPGQDYVIRYEDNGAVGTAKIYIDGINNYLGSLSGTFQIIQDYGQVQTPKAVTGLKYNGRVQVGVPESANGYYTLTDHMATDAGSYVATAKLADGYIWEDETAGDKQISYSIDRADALLTAERTSIFLKEDAVSSSVRIVYSGDNPQSLAVTSANEQVAKAEIKDGVLTVQAMGPGIAWLTLSAQQGTNYNAAESTVIVEVPGEREYAVANTPSGVSLEYNGRPQAGILATDGYEFVDLPKECSLDDIGNVVARDVGSYTVTVKPVADYPWQEVAVPAETTVTFTVTAVDADRVRVADIAPVIYTGSAITPKVEATFKGARLTENSDYTLTYQNNVNAGDATVELAFQGNYTGTAEKKFEITKAPATLSIKPSSFAFNLKNGNQTDTAAITYTGDGTLEAVSSNASVAVAAVEGRTLKISAGSTEGTAKITVSASGETNYLEVGPVTVTVTVTKSTGGSTGGGGAGGGGSGGGGGGGGTGGGSTGGGSGGGAGGGAGGSTGGGTGDSTGGGTDGGTGGDAGEVTNGGADHPSSAFIDIDTNAWYYEAVDYAIRNGLLNGYGNGVFGPNNTLSRDMLAQILYNLEGRPAVVSSSAFTDVPPGTWYVDAVTWAAANGIVEGYGNGLFAPGALVTREQMVTMLYRYAKATKGEADLTAFVDAESVSGWALDAMTWAVSQGILTGKDGACLDPQGTATRAEVATILQRFVELVK